MFGLNMPALITQSRLKAQWVIGCVRVGWVGNGGEGGGEVEKMRACVWHVNSNQSPDIHQAAWPTVRINFREGGLANTPLCFASRLSPPSSHFPPRSLSPSSCFLPFRSTFSSRRAVSLTYTPFSRHLPIPPNPPPPPPAVPASSFSASVIQL